MATAEDVGKLRFAIDAADATSKEKTIYNGPRLVESVLDSNSQATNAARDYLDQTVDKRELSPAMRQLVFDGFLKILANAWRQGKEGGDKWQRAVSLLDEVIQWNYSSQCELPGPSLCNPIRSAMCEAEIDPLAVKALMTALERPGAAMRDTASAAQRLRRHCHKLKYQRTKSFSERIKTHIA